jgi:hypothetical protein
VILVDVILFIVRVMVGGVVVVVVVVVVPVKVDVIH